MRIQISFNPKSKKILKTTKDQKITTQREKYSTTPTSKQSTYKPISLEAVVKTRTMIPNTFHFRNSRTYSYTSGTVWPSGGLS